ncbi:hypothetical protein ACHQM5_015024 [Ranunculus cassubicifolius]
MHLNRSKEYKSYKGKLVIRDLYDTVYVLDDFQESNQAVEIKLPTFRVGDCETRMRCQNIWGSCNGVICIQLFYSIEKESPLYLWNPSTTEYKEMPRLRTHPLGSGTAYGFGYNLDINDYEILAVTCLEDPHSYRSAVDVYSVRNNRWRTFADIPYETAGMTTSGVQSNSAFHWMGITSEDRRSHGQCYYPLISYDPRNERCTEIPLPDMELIMGCDTIVQKFGEKLCVLHDLNLWVMNEYGVKDSWTKLLSVEQVMSRKLMYYPLCSTECGSMVMRGLDGSIILYDPEKKTDREIHFVPNVYEVIYCLESIVGVDINI